MDTNTAEDREKAEEQKAQREFTDREEPRETFWKLHRLLREDMEQGRPQVHVLNYYGFGGIGKSRLCQKLRDELEKQGGWDAVNYDFRTEGVDMETVFNALKSPLEGRGYRFPLFEAALFYYRLKLGRSKESDDPTAVRSTLERYPMAKQAVEVLGLVVPGLEMAAKFADKIDEKVRGLLQKNKEELYRIAAAEPKALKDKLPEYFGRDLTENIKERKKPLTIFLDTYERLVDPRSANADADSADFWLRSLERLDGGVIFNAGGVLWVILGREKLKWAEKDPRWNEALECHNLGKLSEPDAVNFLRKTGMADEQLRRELYALTDGWPLYLDMCMDIHDELINAGRTPKREDFGSDLEKLKERLYESMTDAQRDCGTRLACLGIWTDELAVRVVVDRLAYDKVKRMSFVKEDKGIYTIHSEVRDVLEHYCEAYARRETLETAEAYYGERLAKATAQDEAYAPLLLNYAACGVKRRQTPEELERFFRQEIDGRLDALLQDWRAEPVLRCVRFFEAHEQLRGQSSPLTSRLLRLQAHACRLMGQYRQAMEYALQDLELCRSLRGERDGDTTVAMHNLAVAYSDLGRYREAQELWEQVLALRGELLGERDPNTVTAMHHLAVSYSKLGRRQEAMALRQRVLALRRELLGERHPDTVAAMHNLAVSYSDLGREQEAEELRRQVLALQTDAWGERHPYTIAAMNDLAISYSKQGREQEAVELREQVLALRRERLGEGHPDTLDAMRSLAASYSKLRRRQEAKALRETVLAAQTERMGERDPETLADMHALVLAYGGVKQYEEARALAEKELTLQRERVGERHPDTLTAMADLALAYGGLAQYQRARELAETVLSLRKELLGEGHPDTLMAMMTLVSVYQNLGMKDQEEQMWAELERQTKSEEE